jgi:hypothetical protein
VLGVLITNADALVEAVRSGRAPLLRATEQSGHRIGSLA